MESIVVGFFFHVSMCFAWLELFILPIVMFLLLSLCFLRPANTARPRGWIQPRGILPFRQSKRWPILSFLWASGPWAARTRNESLRLVTTHDLSSFQESRIRLRF
ncbi:hypothetical protein EV361DRAFT_191688 [Lentinula raphanica]|nr:hypothetical protein C8R42DRAFT_670155 [Lentinula raphanica]KAJ3978064.1 hypothetical protein EV361DRAFT_191688 [Lentinula raphanica]